MNRTPICFTLILFFAVTAFAQTATFPAGSDVTAWSEDATSTIALQASALTDARTHSTPSSLSRSVQRSKSCSATLGSNGSIDALTVTYTNSPVGASSYVVTPHDVTYASGGAPSAEEVEFVRSDNASFGRFRALNKVFGGKTFAAGAVVKVNHKDAEALFNIEEGTRVADIDVTLRSVEDGVATFDVTMTLESNAREKKTGEAGAGKLTTALGGTLSMDLATTHPVRLELTGSISGDTRKKNGAPGAGSASGTTTLTVDYSY